MTPTSLIIVADRGSVKAYRVDPTPNRGASLHLVQAFDITDAHGRYQDKLSDQAGSFPMGDANGTGRHANSIAERTALEMETDRRICKQLAEQIAEIVKREATEGWSFAAPSSIHGVVTDLLPKPIRDRVVEHVNSDLVKIEPAKLRSHFRSLQPL
ncbi:MAG: host attachment protein [Spartobacteria bacterium]